MENNDADAALLRQPLLLQKTKEEEECVTLVLGGLTCSSCVTSVSQVLSELDGASNVNVTLLPEAKATLLIDRRKLNAQNVIDEVESIGFEAHLVRNNKQIILRNDGNIIKPNVLEDLLRGFRGKSREEETSENENNDDGIIKNVGFVNESNQNEIFLEYDSNRILGPRDAISHAFGISSLEEIQQVFVRSASSSAQQLLNMENNRQKEIHWWKIRFYFSLFFCVPILIISMGFGMMNVNSNAFTKFLNGRTVFNFQVQDVILFSLATPVQFIAGFVFYRESFYAVVKRRSLGGMSFLVMLGSSAAYFYSCFATIDNATTISNTHGGIVNTLVHMNDGEEHLNQTYETSSVLICFVLLGKYLECIAKGRTSQALTKLTEHLPQTASVVTPDSNEVFELSCDLVQKNDLIQSLPGTKIAVDGVVTQHTSSTVDTSALTGESIPKFVEENDRVFAGTINLTSLLYIRVTTLGDENMASSTVKLIEQSLSTKTQVELWADRVIRVFTPTVVVLSFSTFIGWMVYFSTASHPHPTPTTNHQNHFVYSLLRAVTVLVISCPCALGIATPSAITVGTGILAQNGILIKNASKIENISKVKAVVFDKTGTLTKGAPRVIRVELFSPSNNNNNNAYALDQVLFFAAVAEKASTHPIADCVVKYYLQTYGKENLESLTGSSRVGEMKEIAGVGIQGKITSKEDNVDILIGNKRVLELVSVVVPVPGEVLEKYANLESSGYTVLIVCINQQVECFICVLDTARLHTRSVVTALRTLYDVDCYMLTGDNFSVAHNVACSVGIEPDKVIANCLPVDKSNKIGELKSLYGKQGSVLYVGDGINDAPALVVADVGVAMNGGIDIAAESADVVLLNELDDLFVLIHFSKYCYARIRLNLFFSMIYNVVMIPVAMVSDIPPMVGSLMMALSSVSVVTSSLLLKRYSRPCLEYFPNVENFTDDRVHIVDGESVIVGEVFFNKNCAMIKGSNHACTCDPDRCKCKICRELNRHEQKATTATTTRNIDNII